MEVRCWVVFLLLHLTSKVSPLDIESFVGETVILPCFNEGQQEITSVFWRHNLGSKVLSIIQGQLSLEDQDKIFINRTESFPSEYKKGNYSIQLKDVQLAHAGNYTCFFPELNERKAVQLFVKDKPVEPTRKPSNSSMEAQSQKILIFLIALLGVNLHYI